MMNIHLKIVVLLHAVASILYLVECTLIINVGHYRFLLLRPLLLLLDKYYALNTRVDFLHRTLIDLIFTANDK
jgi:hypothetical protein